MRNYKLRISTLVLSKLFQKLKNMTKPITKNPPPSYSSTTTKKKKPFADSKSLLHSSSSSSYISSRSHTSLESKTLQISPRNSLHMKQSKRKTVYKPSPPSSSYVSAGFNKNKIKSLRNHDSFSASSNLKLTFAADDIIIDIDNRDFKKKTFKDIKVVDSTVKACSASNSTKETLNTHHLPVKVINKEKKHEEEDSCRVQKKHHQQTFASNGRRSANSPRLKLRVTSPRIHVKARRSGSRSQNRQVLQNFAVIKNSVDPKKDFRESMVEMIAENNIRASKDLEDLLVCYLSLNHKEYHDLIIKVFVQVWLEVITSTLA